MYATVVRLQSTSFPPSRVKRYDIFLFFLMIFSVFSRSYSLLPYFSKATLTTQNVVLSSVYNGFAFSQIQSPIHHVLCCICVTHKPSWDFRLVVASRDDSVPRAVADARLYTLRLFRLYKYARVRRTIGVSDW